MKKLRIPLSSLLAFLMLLTTLSVNAFGQTIKADEFTPFEDSLQEEAEVDVQNNDDGTFSITISSGDVFESRTAEDIVGSLSSSYRFDGTIYSQLTPRQKTLYNIMDETSVDKVLASPSSSGNANTKQVTSTVEGLSGTVIDGYFSNDGSFHGTDNSNLFISNLFHDMSVVPLAIYYDVPAAIWCINVSSSISFETVGSNQVKITTIDYLYNLEFQGREKQLYDEMNAAVDRIIAAVINPNDDRYTKISKLQEYMIKNNKYSDDLANNPTMIHLPYSALIFGDNYDPVCNGYASAFKMLCDKLKIPCVMVTSFWDAGNGAEEGHAWNNILMDDGYWYNLDLTNDGSQSPTVKKDFFLVGTEAMAGHYMFVEKASYDSSLGKNTINFKFPQKSTVPYEYIGGPKFPDIKAGAWFYDLILGVAKVGLFRGDEDGKFNPGNSITRAEFASVLTNLYKPDTSGYKTSAFPDVKEGSWYLGAIEWAKSQGYMSGDADGNFRPQANISRQEMCIVFANILKQRQEAPSSTFIDDNSIADYAYSSVYACKDLGLVSGDNTGKFNPQANSTRAEAASVFSNFIDLKEKEDSKEEEIPDDDDGDTDDKTDGKLDDDKGTDTDDKTDNDETDGKDTDDKTENLD